MSTKSYTVRISQGTPEVTSDQVAKWLDVTSPDKLGADPGAGERSLRLSLDADKVKAGAQAAGEPEAVFLRRLIASNVKVRQESEKPEVEAKPKAPVLKGALRLQPEQVRPLVHLFDAGQSYVIRKAFRVPPHPAVLQAAAYTEEEREQLSVAGCEALNRRAPRALVEKQRPGRTGDHHHCHREPQDRGGPSLRRAIPRGRAAGDKLARGWTA